MDLVAVVEHRFNRTPDGRVWTQTMFAYPFWTEYLAVFARVRVVARIRDVPSISEEDWQRADGKDVTFITVPHYIGMGQYLFRAWQVRNVVRNAAGPRDAVIFRVSSQIAGHLEPLLRRTGHPYGLQVVGDPYDVFAPGAVRLHFRPFLRWWFTRQLRQQCAGASAVAYVTERALQRRYPPASDAYATTFSDVDLPDRAFVSAPRGPKQGEGPRTLITVGSLAQMYKAPDILLAAIAACVRAGLDLRLVMIGDGRHRTEMEDLAVRLGIADRVCFRGEMPAGQAIREALDGADVFILPSRTEGLPRAMVEAMARALPCIGSTVGGIPELLPPEDMVPPDDVTALAEKIREVATDPARMAAMSARNFQHALGFHHNILHARRTDFYRAVQERTDAWISRTSWANAAR